MVKIQTLNFFLSPRFFLYKNTTQRQDTTTDTSVVGSPTFAWIKQPRSSAVALLTLALIGKDFALEGVEPKNRGQTGSS